MSTIKKISALRSFAAAVVVLIAALAFSPVPLFATDLGYSDVYGGEGGDYGYSDIYPSDYGYSDIYPSDYGSSDIYPSDYGYSDIYPYEGDYGYSDIYPSEGDYGYSDIYPSETDYGYSDIFQQGDYGHSDIFQNEQGFNDFTAEGYFNESGFNYGSGFGSSFGSGSGSSFGGGFGSGFGGGFSKPIMPPSYPTPRPTPIPHPIPQPIPHPIPTPRPTPIPHPIPTPIPQPIPPRPVPQPYPYPQPIPVPQPNVNINTNTNTCTGQSCNTVITDNSVRLAPVTPQPIVQHQFPQQNLYCVINVNIASVQNGMPAVLTWTSNGTSAIMSDGIGPVNPNGSLIVRPEASRTYTLTVYGQGGVATCRASVNVIGGAPFVSLSQIPYTGFDFGPFGNALYWAGLVAFAGAAAYLALYFAPVALSAVRMPRASFAAPVAALSYPAAPAPVAEATVVAPAPAPETPKALALETLPTSSVRSVNDTMAIVRDADGTPRIVIERA